MGNHAMACGSPRRGCPAACPESQNVDMIRKKAKKPQPPGFVMEIPVFVDQASDHTDNRRRIGIEKRLDLTFTSLPHPHDRGKRIVGIVIPDAQDDWIESPTMIIQELLSEAERELISDEKVHQAWRRDATPTGPVSLSHAGLRDDAGAHRSTLNPGDAGGAACRFERSCLPIQLAAQGFGVRRVLRSLRKRMP